MGWKHVLLVCVSLLPGHLLLQVSHQMVQRGHGKALQTTVYHGYHKGHTPSKKFTSFLHRAEKHHSFLSSSHEEYEHPSVGDPSSTEDNGPPPPSDYGPPPPAKYGPPPPEEYGPPPPEEYVPPPPEEYGPPPPEEYVPPTPEEYGPPPPEGYGPHPPEEYGPPPPEEYGPPPPEEYGPPPPGDHKPMVVKNYIPHNVFTHFVNPAPAEDYVTYEQHGSPLPEEYGPPPPDEYGPPPPEEDGPPPPEEYGPSSPEEYGPPLPEELPVFHEPTPIQHFVFYHDSRTPAHPSPPAPILSSASPQTVPKAYLISNYPDDPPVYKYSYSVDDEYTGAVLSVEEARDQEYTHGSYQVSLPDGRMQSVQYTSSQYGGYKARVEYRDKYSSYSRS